MECKRTILTTLFFISVVFTSHIICAEYDLPLEIKTVKKKIGYGDPLMLNMHLTLEEPYISPYSGKPSEIYNLDGLRLAIENTKTHRSSIFIFRLPVSFQSQNDTGRGYSTDEVILWDLYKERKKLIANLIFDSTGTYSLTLLRAKRTVSNTIELVIEDSELGERALSLLAEPNDLAFLMGGLFKSPQTVSTLKEVGRQCEGTVLAKWAAARLGIEYFADFHKKQPSFKKAAELYKQGSLEDPSFKAAYSYLRQATELPDEFPIRSEALGELVELLCVTGELDDALKLSGELVNKYPHTEHGRKARLWEKELAELQQAEQIRQATPDPNNQAENNEGRRNSRRWLVLGGAVGVAIAAGVVLVVLVRKKPRAK